MVDLHNQAEGLMLAGGEIKNDFNAFLTVKRFMSERHSQTKMKMLNFLTSTKDSSTMRMSIYLCTFKSVKMIQIIISDNL